MTCEKTLLPEFIARPCPVDFGQDSVPASEFKSVRQKNWRNLKGSSALQHQKFTLTGQ